MQHKPHLSETLENLLKGRLKDTSYPFVDGQKGVGPNLALQRYGIRHCVKALADDPCPGRRT